MRVKCVASVAPILFRGDRESVVQNLPINKDMREALLLGEWSTFIEYDHLDGTDPVIHFLKHVLFYLEKNFLVTVLNMYNMQVFYAVFNGTVLKMMYSSWCKLYECWDTFIIKEFHSFSVRSSTSRQEYSVLLFLVISSTMLVL